ncbi:MAG: hypothetical protein WD601_03185, partial [Pseudohongiellaceae bacterium]
MAKEKVMFDIPDSAFPFVPTISELMGWLGGPKGLHTPLYWMQQDMGLNSPDLNTLRKACQDGVTLRTAEMIKANIHQAAWAKGFTELLEEVAPKDPIVSGTNGTKWLQQSRCFLEVSNRHQPTKLKLPRTFTFLEQRIEAESQLMLVFHRANSMDALTEKKLTLIRTAFCETCRHHTLLTSQEIHAYGTAIVGTNRLGQPKSLELVADVLKLTFSLRVDFYHQLLASFMVDMLPIRKTLKLPASLDDALVNHGAMGQLMPLLKQGELITPTYRLYELWCEAFSPPGESLSYRAMAMHLPRPDPGRTRVGSDSDQQDIESVVNETRLSRLKEWRGGTVPDTDQLTAFLESMTGETY